MKPPENPLTELESLLTDEQRENKPLSPAGHHEWREGISIDSRPFDEIDRAVDDPYHGDPPSKRSEKETSRVLSILDSLDDERGIF